MGYTLKVEQTGLAQWEGKAYWTIPHVGHERIIGHVIASTWRDAFDELLKEVERNEGAELPGYAVGPRG